MWKLDGKTAVSQHAEQALSGRIRMAKKVAKSGKKKAGARAKRKPGTGAKAVAAVKQTLSDALDTAKETLAPAAPDSERVE